MSSFVNEIVWQKINFLQYTGGKGGTSKDLEFAQPRIFNLTISS